VEKNENHYTKKRIIKGVSSKRVSSKSERQVGGIKEEVKR